MSHARRINPTTRSPIHQAQARCPVAARQSLHLSVPRHVRASDAAHVPGSPRSSKGSTVRSRSRLAFASFLACMAGVACGDDLVRPHSGNVSPPDEVLSSSESEVAATVPIKVLAHNVWLLRTHLAGIKAAPGRVERAPLIAQADYVRGYDVVILDELLDSGNFLLGEPSANDLLLTGLKSQYPHQTPVVGDGSDNWTDKQGDQDRGIVAGGVAIVSRWRIAESVEYVFKEAGCAADSKAAKGFAYVAIDKVIGNDTTRIHVIGTHTQAVASPSGEPIPPLCLAEESGQPYGATARKAQFKEIADWIDTTTVVGAVTLGLGDRAIDTTEVLIIGGDMNVHIGTTEWFEMLDILNVTTPIFPGLLDAGEGHDATWDPKTNDLIADFAPGERRYLDYVFVHALHRQPSGWTNLAMNPSLYPDTWADTTLLEIIESDEFSDHYPVAGFSSDADGKPTHRERVRLYDRVRFRSLSFNRYVGREDTGNGWIIANRTSPSWRTEFMLEERSLDEADPFCFTTGSFIPIKSIHNNYYWNWFGGVIGHSGYFMKFDDPQNNLTIEMVSPTSGCLQDGDIVAFKSIPLVFAGHYIRTWDEAPGFLQRDWRKHLFLWDNEITGRANKFQIGVVDQSVNGFPVPDAGPDQTVECTSPSGTEVQLDGSGSSDPDGDALTHTWTGPFVEGGGTVTGETPTVTLPLGTHTITLTVDDGEDSDTDEVVITVEDTTPPEISLALLTDELWAANHKMVLVASGVSASDVCDDSPVLTVSVTSNEAADGLGDGKTEPDWDVVDNGDGTFDVHVMAERSGRGDHRIYTITASAMDASGNEASVTAEVTVPHSRAKND